MGHAIVLGFGFCIGVVLFLLIIGLIGLRNEKRREEAYAARFRSMPLTPDQQLRKAVKEAECTYQRANRKEPS
jgi:hypothetical protein